MPQKIEYPKIDFADRIIAKKCYDKAREMLNEDLSNGTYVHDEKWQCQV